MIRHAQDINTSSFDNEINSYNEIKLHRIISHSRNCTTTKPGNIQYRCNGLIYWVKLNVPPNTGCNGYAVPVGRILQFRLWLNCLLCISYRVPLSYPRPTVYHFLYMYICRILSIRPLGWHIEINTCHTVSC